MAPLQFPIVVTLERRTLNNRWASHQWRAVAARVEVSAHGVTTLTPADAEVARWEHSGFMLELFRDEAEGHFLNVSTDTPQLFIMWRMDEANEQAVPHLVTASYNMAGRLLDGGETVEGVPMPEALIPIVREFVAAHYKPEPKRRQRPQSFKRLDERAKIH